MIMMILDGLNIMSACQVCLEGSDLLGVHGDKLDWHIRSEDPNVSMMCMEGQSWPKTKYRNHSLLRSVGVIGSLHNGELCIVRSAAHSMVAMGKLVREAGSIPCSGQ